MKVLYIEDGFLKYLNHVCISKKKKYSVDVHFLWFQEPDMLLKALWDVSFDW